MKMSLSLELGFFFYKVQEKDETKKNSEKTKKNNRKQEHTRREREREKMERGGGTPVH